MSEYLQHLYGDRLRVAVAPQHGFTIASVELVDNAENVLWNPPGASFAALSDSDLGPSGEESVGSFDREVLAGGWFPMFPTAGLPGAAVDRWMHGELPRIRWNVENKSGAHITASVDTPATGIRVDRTVRIEGDTIMVTTIAHNRSGQTRHITFGEHPCFSRETFAAGRLEVSPTSARATSVADPANAFLAGGNEFTWPDASTTAGEPIDLAGIPRVSDGRHDHVSLIGLARARIRGLDHIVDLEWDGGTMPHALLWEHFAPDGSPWPGDVFAIEPMSAPGRTFDDAIAAGAVTALGEDQILQTWMSMRVRPA